MLKVAPADHRAHLEEIFDRLLATGARCVHVGQWTPIGDQPDEVWTRARFLSYRADARAVSEARGIPWVDVEEVLGPRPDEHFVENRIHYTAEGHLRIADALVEILAPGASNPAGVPGLEPELP